MKLREENFSVTRIILGKAVLTKIAILANLFLFHRLGGCRYVNGTHYLYEKYIQLPLHRVELDTMLDIYTNTAINFAFPGAVILVNMIWYLVPLPAFVKAKFRE